MPNCHLYSSLLFLVFVFCIVINADGSRMSMAIIRVCYSMCESVCLSVHMIKPKRLKVQSPNFTQR